MLVSIPKLQLMYLFNYFLTSSFLCFNSLKYKIEIKSGLDDDDTDNVYCDVIRTY